jgi:tRNA-dihydrouridine synthase B
MSLMIGALPIAGDLLLAPLDGYGDPPYRLLCRAFGAAFSYVPIVPAEAVLARRRAKRPLVSFYEGERPVGIQFLTRHPEQLARAIERVLPLQPALIDLNLGCPARKVVASCRGARLLQEPELIGALMAAAVRVSPVPVTAKIRLGWDFFSRNHVEVARILEQNGVAAIAVHGRTRVQAYRGEADWDAIREVREAVSVPVIANGDVSDVAAIEAILAQTGCPAAMVARGAFGNPWIFARRNLADVPLAERMQLVARHLHMSALHYGPTRGVISFRKHVVHYIKGLPGAAAVRTRLMEPTSAEQMLAVLAEHAGLDEAALAALYGEDEREIRAWMGELCA